MHQLARYQLVLTRLAALLGGAVALCAFLYGGFLLGAVAHTAAQTSLEHQAGKLSASISTLETQYFMITRAITPERAGELGFVPPQEHSIVVATAASKALSLQGLTQSP